MFGFKKKKFKRHYKKQARRKFFQKSIFWKIVILIVLLGALVYVFLFSPLFRIQQIQVRGQIKIEPEKIKEYVNKNIESRFSKSLFGSFKSIEKNLPQQLNLLKKVTIKKDFPHSLIIQLEERKPFFKIRYNQNSYIVDQEGVILKRNREEAATTSSDLTISVNEQATSSELENNSTSAPSTSEKLFLIESLIETKKESGAVIYEEEKWSSLFSLWNNLNELSLIAPLQKIIISSWEKVTFITDQGVELYLNINREGEWQITKLKTILKQKKGSEFANLNYVDLRYDNYIFTKDHPEEGEN